MTCKTCFRVLRATEIQRISATDCFSAQESTNGLEGSSNGRVASSIFINDFVSKRRRMSSTRRLGQSSGIGLVERDLTGRRRRSSARRAVRSGRTVRSRNRSRSVPESLDPSSVSDGNTLPLQQLVLDAINAFDPPLGVSLAAIAAVQDELVAEDGFRRFVAVDFSPLTVTVFEQVAGGHDSRFRVHNGLYIGAEGGLAHAVS